MVVAELDQVRTMLDGGMVEDELQLALQALIFHQCLYEEWPSSKSYRLIVRNLQHIRPIIAAFGFRLEYQPLFKMLAVRLEQPLYGLTMNRLRKDETVVLLCLRLLYEDQMRAGSSDDAGRVLTISSELYDHVRRPPGDTPPAAGRLFEILGQFQRRGLVRVGVLDDQQVANVTIYPGVAMLVPETYVGAIDTWLSQQEDARPTMLQHLAASLAGASDPDRATGEEQEDSDVPA
jgi:hypothetical protein